MKFKVTNTYGDEKLINYRKTLQQYGLSVGDIYEEEYYDVFDINIIDLESLVYMMYLVKEPLIISEEGAGYNKIEIYDDYRE